MMPPPKIGIGILNFEFRCRATSLLRKNDVFPRKNIFFLRYNKVKKVDLGGGGHHIYISFFKLIIYYFFNLDTIIYYFEKNMKIIKKRILWDLYFYNIYFF